eukprot:6750888-Alexandrium_andersonii.AAC.1
MLGLPAELGRSPCKRPLDRGVARAAWAGATSASSAPSCGHTIWAIKRNSAQPRLKGRQQKCSSASCAFLHLPGGCTPGPPAVPRGGHRPRTTQLAPPAHA